MALTPSCSPTACGRPPPPCSPRSRSQSTMGAAPSVPTEAITEIASKTMKVFTPFYIKGYAGALVKQLKREAAPAPNPFHLMNITPPSEPIKMVGGLGGSEGEGGVGVCLAGS